MCLAARPLCARPGYPAARLPAWAVPSLIPLPSPPPPLLQDITLPEFQLPAFGPKLRAMLLEVTHGRGFQLLRGVPVDRFTRKQSALAYWWVLAGCLLDAGGRAGGRTGGSGWWVLSAFWAWPGGC